MTTQEKIESWIQSNPEIQEHYYVSKIEDNLYIYSLKFVEGSDKMSQSFDISVNEDDTISYLEHLRNINN
jgi:acyl carrier protein